MNNTAVLNAPLSVTRYLIWKINLKNFWLFAFVLLILSLVFYIFQINAVISESYLVQNYEKKLSEIRQENKKLEITFYQENSLENIEGLVKNLNFEKVNKINYIQILEGQVVTKQSSL